MTVKFLHTADWQIGKPFAGVDDSEKRTLLRNARLSAIRRIAELAEQQQVAFVLVAGDLFDSPSASQATVSAACSEIGSIPVPVFAIPGNHDHGGPGGLWEQEFFQRERESLAPNLRLLLKAEPVELEEAVIFPCPLLRRHESVDPTAWLRSEEIDFAPFQDKPRIVLAHGSVTDFGGPVDEEEQIAAAANFIDLKRIDDAAFDFIALGDWHGTKQVGPKAWYCGTPELDRFVKGADHDPGNVLGVEVTRRGTPAVERVETQSVGWHELTAHFAEDASLQSLEGRVAELIGNRANQDLLRLELDGSLGFSAYSRLEQLIESWKARLIRLKLINRTTLAPSDEELEQLTHRSDDPLISSVACRLMELLSGESEEAVVARAAMRQLYSECRTS